MNASLNEELTDPRSGAALYRDVIAYANLGVHLTASEVDHRTSAWLAARLRPLGFETSYLPFHLPQFFARDVRLEVFGRALECVPQWFPCWSSSPVRSPVRLTHC